MKIRQYVFLKHWPQTYNDVPTPQNNLEQWE